VQGKLISHLSTNLTTSVTSSRPTDSSLGSFPSNDSSRSVNNASVNNDSVNNHSVNNDSVYSASVYNDSVNNDSVNNDLVNNDSVNNFSIYTASVNGALVSGLYSPSISLFRTLSSHTTSSEVTTPIRAIPTTIIPGIHIKQQQSLPNIPTPPFSSGGTSTADHPQNSPRPSAPNFVSLGQPITDAQHNLNANEDQHGPLPEGWERGIDPLGLTYYVNRHTRSITRNRPSPNQAVDHQAQEGEATTTGSGSLPAGWEERCTPEGRPYYVNSNTGSTTWVDPRRQTIIRGMGPNGQSTSLQPQTVSQLGPLLSGWGAISALNDDPVGQVVLERPNPSARGHTAIEFRLVGSTHSGISVKEALDGVRQSQINAYLMHDVSVDMYGKIPLIIRWMGYCSVIYKILLSSDYYDNVDMQHLARRTARAIVNFMAINSITLSLNRVVMHRLEEISLGVWVPVLTTH